MSDIPDDEELADARVRANHEAEKYQYTIWVRMLNRLDAAEAENGRLRAQVEAAEKELAIANRIVLRHLPDLVEAVRAEVAALSDEGKPDAADA